MRKEHPDSFPVVIQFPVAWGEMDAFQHVNNATYFRYFESARIAYFDQLGVMESMKTQGAGPILASTSCRFKAPLTYPDTVQVRARVGDMAETQFQMHYQVYSEKLQRVAAEGEGLIVYFDYQNHNRTAIPDAIRQGIIDLESKPA